MSSKLYTTPFILLCASNTLFAASFNMMLPELPHYLESLGGGGYKGLILGLFTLTAGLSRPFSGKLADTIGRLPVMYVGTYACVVSSLLYPPLATVSGFLALRFFHGFSTGFKPTGTSAYAADIVPYQRRGEAMGALGICFSLGASASPPLGSWLVQAHGIQWMFYTSALFALLSVVIIYNLPETLEERRPFRLSALRIRRDDIYDTAVFPSAIVMILSYASYGAALTLAPDLSDALGVANRGVFFTIFTLASIATRLFAGRLSDRIGRVPVLRASTLLISLAMIGMAWVQAPWLFYLSTAVFGLGLGVFSPAITAWTVDLGNPMRRGRAMATMYIALEIAIGSGAVLSGWYFANELGRMPFVFLAAGALSLGAFFYLLFYREKTD